MKRSGNDPGTESSPAHSIIMSYRQRYFSPILPRKEFDAEKTSTSRTAEGISTVQENNFLLRLNRI